METIQTLVGFAKRAKANTVAAENLEQVPITRATLPLMITIMMKTGLNPQMPIKHTTIRLTLEVTTEKRLWTMMMENDTFSSHVPLDDVTVFEAAELDAIALLADTWNDDLDTHVSAQLVQANVQAHLSFGKEKGKGEGKGKSKGKYPVRPSLLSLEDRRRRLSELKAKTEYRACGRMGHWAHHRECAMSPSSSSTQNQTRTARITTQQHLSNQAKKVGMCFVLNDYSDDPNTSAYMVGRNVPLARESAGQTLLTPMAPAAPAAVDTKKGGIFDIHDMDDNDEPWLSETDQKSGWDKEFKSGTYHSMLYGIVLPDYPKQVVSLVKAKSVPANMLEFLSLGHKDTTALT